MVSIFLTTYLIKSFKIAVRILVCYIYFIRVIFRGMVDEEGDQFVAYFLPTIETLQKRKTDVEEVMDYNPEETYDYKLAREYNWNVKNKASKGYEENYYFVMREDGVFYNELETR